MYLAKPFFFVFTTHKLPSKHVFPIARINGQVCRRMIWKKVATVRRIIVVDNTPIIFRIFICFAIGFLQSNTSLKSIKHKSESKEKVEQIYWRHMTSSAFLWSFTRFQSLGKAVFERPKFFESQILKFTIVNCDQNHFIFFRVVYTL